MNNSLAAQVCVPCQGGIPPLNPDEVSPLLEKIDSNWQVIDNKKISREFVFKKFLETIDFVNKIAELAEAAGHHPDMHVHYNKLVIDLWTHKINGLHDNDFIVAAKIDEIFYNLPK